MADHPKGLADTQLSIANKDADTVTVEVNGVEVVVLTTQDGDKRNFPVEGQTVRIDYILSLANGSVIDSTREPGRKPVDFQIGSGEVVPGLEAGVKTMSRGQFARIKIPPEAAYGEDGVSPFVAPNMLIIYDVELITFANTSTPDGAGKKT
mmetsp:Transcript_5909/g.13654  ORF Transcript_5909/g.13654 Transcript_5909/m.13654 type:complete len:151 (+) Transcript_5909:73-525(+)